MKNFFLKNKLYKKRWLYGFPALLIAIIIGKWVPVYLYVLLAIVNEKKWLAESNAEGIQDER